MSEDEGSKEKIAILLAEYSTIKSEIVQKNNAFVQTVGIGCATAIGVIAAAVASQRLQVLWLLLLIAILLAANLFAIDAICVKLMSRARIIERDINRRIGENLMQWESSYGWGGTLRRRSRKQLDAIDREMQKLGNEAPPSRIRDGADEGEQ